MCGRYTMVSLKSFADDNPWVSLFDGADGWEARYNIAPTQPVPILANHTAGKIELAHWGLIPSWAKEASIGSRMINARAETLAEKPSFRTALRKRRCLIPVDGFYEWKLLSDGKSKQPMYIRLRSARPFAFAGLWELWRDPAGEMNAGEPVVSCTIITTTPNDLMAQVHNRMPVILPPDQYQSWLDPTDRPAETLTPLLRSYDASAMEMWPVSKSVNRPGNDTPTNIDPVPPAE